MTIGRLATAALAASLLAAPAAASDFDARQLAGERSGSFAGATLRVPLGGGRDLEARRPRLAIGLSQIDERVDTSGRIDRRISPALELDFARGRPTLLVAGEPPTNARDQRQRLAPGATLLVIAGVAAVVFVLSEFVLDDDDEPESLCFIPEGYGN